ncbi:MAG TPA: M28 family peptidase [Synergistaceae bacterium]|nr:M28 family peptidase [Synergistaceae bacterium]HPJ26978.1 M28 family peptidase [Synergistaceae bacterium]
MLSSQERSLLQEPGRDSLERNLQHIASHNRLSGSSGERKAVEYLASELEEKEIPFEIQEHRVRLSNPLRARLLCTLRGKASFEIPAKAWSFTHSGGLLQSRGEACFLDSRELPSTFPEYLLERKKYPRDLEGKIILGTSGMPFQIRSLQDRGAAGYILCWSQGEEEEIHEGNINMVWGTPLPEDLELFLEMPVVAVNHLRGKELIRLAEEGSLEAAMEVELQDLVTSVPLLEATLSAPSGNLDYLLIGNHLDSWHYGACDNATGNALCLELARKLKEIQPLLKRGVRIAWWSGHSNGRYAGSSSYAGRNYGNLLEHCLAYMNVDMPGLRGARDYSTLTAGPDLFELGREALEDITGYRGNPAPHIRGWDQSFQNLGISPYFIWGSALSPGHPDSTGNSFMSWWWHTEKDLPEYCDLEVLQKDLSLYLLGAFRFLTAPGESLYQPEKLFDSILERLSLLERKIGKSCDLAPLREHLHAASRSFRERKGKGDLSWNLQKQVLRKLNQIYYAEKASSLQDYAIPEDYIPGLSTAASLVAKPSEEHEELYTLRYLETRKNRLHSLGWELRFLCSEKA